MAIAIIDFEIANSNYNSACSMGIVVIDGLKIIEEEYHLIQPPELNFDEEMTKVHGLTIDKLLDADTFDLVWLKIKKYFTGEYIVAAHNAYFDINVLKNLLLHYNESNSDFLYFDTIQYTNPLCNGIGTSLNNRLQHFGIKLNNAHHALEDARATADLIIKATESTINKSVEQYLLHYQIPVKAFNDLNMTTKFFKRKGKKNYHHFKLSDLKPETNNFDEDHPLFNQNIVLTGDLQNFTRQEATQAILNVGGIPKSTVSSKTNYLIVGKQDLAVVGSKGMSSKEIKAAKLIESGKTIKIINEDEFIDLLQRNTDNKYIRYKE